MFITHYVIIAEPNLELLQKRVNEYINSRGYEPHGSLFVFTPKNGMAVPPGSDGGVFCQPMVRLSDRRLGAEA